MKRFFAVSAALVMILSFVPALAAEVKCISLDGVWDFAFYNSYEDTKNGKTGKIAVPGAIELQGYGEAGYYFEERAYWGMPEDDGVHTVGVYSRSFTCEKRKLFLVFDRVRGNLAVFLNGEKIGESVNTEAGSVFEVETKKGENDIAVYVERDMSGMNKSDNFALSGLVGSVYLSESEPYFPPQSREVKIENNALYIDGEKTVLKGVRYTPTHPETGDAMEDEQIEEDLSLIKEYGFNAVWTSEAPDCFYEKAEEKGLYVIDEVNVYLPEADEGAVLRAEETVKRHRRFKSVIMWSQGSGEGSVREIAEAIEREDERPVVQNVNLFADDFEVFGSTGGFEDWFKTLGEGNIGGFIKEFADKELYWTKHVYDFDVLDTAGKNKISVSGEIKYIGGVPMLGEAEFSDETEESDRFTVLSYVSTPDGDREIFSSADGSLKLEVKNGRASMTVNGKSAECALEEGMIALVYADGEAQLFAGHSFKAILQTPAHIGGGFSVGAGDGDTAIKFVKIYDNNLTLDELLTGEFGAREVNSVSFENIEIKKDNSYKFLAYGGDFGDGTNSYYKSLKGLFSSLREPHPEAEEVKALLLGNATRDEEIRTPAKDSASSQVIISDGKAYLTAENASAVINSAGEIESFVTNGAEQLAEPFRPETARVGTLAEYERGVYFDAARFNTKTFGIENGSVHVELISAAGGRLEIYYTLKNDGALRISVQSQFGRDADKPTFIGFVGKTDYTKAVWYGRGEGSSYPDRRNSGQYGWFQSDVKDLPDNYSVPQENGNREAYTFVLKGENGGALSFVSGEALEVTALPYSFEAAEYEDHDENLEVENASYVRVGGYIAGLSENEKYKLNSDLYGFTFEMVGGEYGFVAEGSAVKAALGLGEEFARDVKKYVLRSAEAREPVTEDGYTVYYAREDAYLSDMRETGIKGEVEKKDTVTLSGSRFIGETDQTYKNAVAMKSGSEIEYDVSGFESGVFMAVIGKNAVMMNMGRGGFNRAMFDASADVEIYLDGQLCAEERGISLFSGRRNIALDITGASKLKIAVRGSGADSAQFEDAVLADAKIAPKGPVILDFSRSGENVSITVLNTDAESVDIILTANDSGKVDCVSASISNGLYRTLTLYDVGENADVEAVISGAGRIKPN